MRTTALLLLGTAVAALALPTPALAGKPTRNHYSGSADVRSGAGDLLHSDGRGTYAHPQGNVFVNNSVDDSTEDLFALYVGSRRTFSIRFGSETKVCTGVSHVFFESKGWWEATDDVGEVATGSTGIWCDQGNNTAFAVRYPDYPRNPTTAGVDCVIVQRLEGASGERRYRFASPDQAPASLGACPAKVFYVQDDRGTRTSDLRWEGPAPFEITAVVR